MNTETVKELWENKKFYSNETMHIYIHSPFCVGICNYCIYNSLEMKNTPKIEYDNYYHNLLNQIKEYKDILEYNPADSVYFGGGTPSIMPFNILREIAESIPHWDKIKYKIFEANPISITKDKIDILSELGFTYLALGVQTLDKEELTRQNRKPPKDGHLKEITNYSLNKGMHVNYDIMTLLNDNLEEDMDRVYNDLNTIMKEYKPPSIDVYPMYQKLDYLSDEELYNKIIKLRRTLMKSLFFNKEYHSMLQNNKMLDKENVLKHQNDNYHLINIPEEVYYNERKLYSCSGPDTAPNSQNVIGFGGYKNSWVYSYSSNKDFVYYSQLNEKGEEVFR